MSAEPKLEELAGTPSFSSRLLGLLRARPSSQPDIQHQPLPLSLCKECKTARSKHSISGVLHSNLDKILACLSECAFCAYLCSLVGREKLELAQREILSSGHSQIYLSPDDRVELNQKLNFWWKLREPDTFSRGTVFVTKELTVCGETCAVAQLPRSDRCE